jgi:hypothetical protein
VEGNTVLRNGTNGIFSEVGGSMIIRNNLVGHSVRAIYISESRDTEVYGNTIMGSDRAINLFQDGTRRWESELSNNRISNNTIVVPASSILPGVAPMAVVLNCTNLTSSECASYSTSRGNIFQGNAYTVPSTARYWYWENASKSWSEWRAAGQDTTGTLKIG